MESHAPPASRSTTIASHPGGAGRPSSSWRQPEFTSRSGHASNAPVEGNEGYAQSFCQRDVPGVVGGQAVAELPDPPCVGLVWKEIHPKRDEILVSQRRRVGGQISDEHGPTQDVRRYDRHQMRGGEALTDNLGFGPCQPIDYLVRRPPARPRRRWHPRPRSRSVDVAVIEDASRRQAGGGGPSARAGALDDLLDRGLARQFDQLRAQVLLEGSAGANGVPHPGPRGGAVTRILGDVFMRQRAAGRIHHRICVIEH